MQSQRQNVETIEYYDEQKHLEVVKQGDFDLYENEFELIKDSINLPEPFMALPILQQQIILLYIDDEFVEPYSNKKTKNNQFISFLAAWPKDSVKSKLFKKISVHDGWSNKGDELFVTKIVPNPEMYPTYLKLKAQSSALWKQYNLKDVSKAMRELVVNGGFKDEELLTQKIVDDALSDERDNHTMANRRLAADIKGMKKPSNVLHINVYKEAGGEQATREVIEATGQKAFGLLPDGVE